MANLMARKGNARFSIEAEVAPDFMELGYEILQPAYYVLTEEELHSLLAPPSTQRKIRAASLSLDVSRITLEEINVPVDNGGYAPEGTPEPTVHALESD